MTPILWVVLLLLIVAMVTPSASDVQTPVSPIRTSNADDLSAKERAFLKQHQRIVLDSLRHSHLHWNQQYYSLANDPTDGSPSVRLSLLPLCASKNMLDWFHLSQTPMLDIDFLPIDNVITGENQGLRQKPRSVGNTSALIVYTTSNQLRISIASLHFLSKTHPYADLLVVDDHSTDGTVEYLRKRGFAVITKPRPSGLTDSWNIGYRLAVALGYQHIIFTNNDVLFTTESIRHLSQSHENHALVVPITTQKGAGHHPPQSIFQSWNISLSKFAGFVDDYRNSLAIQSGVNSQLSLLSKGEVSPGQLAETRKIPHFNGFCFSVDTTRIGAAAFSPGVHLFDPNNRIVGQEDQLAKSMHRMNLSAKIVHAAFVFHFKSVTVSSVNFEDFERTMLSRNITVRRHGKTNAKLSFFDPSTGHVRSRMVDLREDLRWYHQDVQLVDDFVNSLLQTLPDAIVHHKHSESKGITPQHNIHKSVGLMQLLDKCPSSSPWKASHFNHSHYFPWSFSNFSVQQKIKPSLTNLYSFWQDYSIDIKASSFCLYPLLWHAVYCGKLFHPNKEVDLNFFATRAISSNVSTANNHKHQLSKCDQNFTEWRYPAFSLAFLIDSNSSLEGIVALSLVEALNNEFSNLRIELLSPTRWYDIRYLHNIDMLITTSPSFNLLRVLDLFQDNPGSEKVGSNLFCQRKRQIKSSLLTVAWIVSDLHQWIGIPWLGHFDVLWSNSNISKLLLEKLEFNLKGFPVHCIHSCPQFQSVANTGESSTWTGFPVYRVPTIIHSFPFAIVDRNSLTIRKKVEIKPSKQIEIGKTDCLVFTLTNNTLTEKFISFPVHVKIFTLANINPGTLDTHWKEAFPDKKGGITDIPYSTESLRDAMKQVKYLVFFVPENQFDSTVLANLALHAVIDCPSALTFSNDIDFLNQYFGEIFQQNGLKLPVVDNFTAINQVTQGYENNLKMRHDTISVMQTAVKTLHNYQRRAQQFADHLTTDFGIHLAPKQIVKSSPIVGKNEEKKRQGVCVAIKTHKFIFPGLKTTLRSLMEPYSNIQSMKDQFSLHFLLADIAPNISTAASLLHFADHFNARYKYPHVNILMTKQFLPTFPNAQKRVFELELSDHLLQAMLSMHSCREDILNMHPNSCSAKNTHLPTCDWIVITDKATIAYSHDWWKVVSPLLEQSNVDAVTWNVMSNATSCDQATKFNSTGHFGSTIMRASVYQRLNARFLADNIFMRDIDNREQELLNYLLQGLNQNKLIRISECLSIS